MLKFKGYREATPYPKWCKISAINRMEQEGCQKANITYGTALDGRKVLYGTALDGRKVVKKQFFLELPWMEGRLWKTHSFWNSHGWKECCDKNITLWTALEGRLCSTSLSPTLTLDSTSCWTHVEKPCSQTLQDKPPWKYPLLKPWLDKRTITPV